MRQSVAGQSSNVGVAQALRRALEPIGMFDARPDELGAVRALAVALISPHVASEESLAAIYRRTGYGVHVVRKDGEVAGVLALIFLNHAGLKAVETDAFNPLDPGLEYIVEGDEPPVAVYCWGIAANRRRAAGTLVEGSWAVRSVLPDTPYFVRAATDAGRRLLTQSMPFTPYPGSTSGLLWWPRYHERTRRAA